jgi:hypothetical protein
MASYRRGSEGEANKSKIFRTLSEARRFFRNGPTPESEINDDAPPPPPFTPEISISNHSEPSSSSDSPSSSDSESPSEKSSKSEKKDKRRKSRKTKKSAKNEKSDYSEHSNTREKNRQKQKEAEYMEYTRSNPLGSALLDIVADNMALHKKLNFKESNLKIGDLCSAFHQHMEGEKDKIKRELEAASEQTEMRILNKELQAYNCKENLPAPKEFSPRNVLTTPSARADAIRIFPTKNKFNGTEHSNGMNIHEFLSLINAAQKQMKLSREEFLEFLLMCTTGRPHILIKDWSENGDDIEAIYYNLFTHYDMRMSPETAREKLYSFKARKNSSLSKVISDIMQLALRAACVHPQGVARTASYNNDAVQALIRCLPPIASDTASNKYHTISSRLQRPATFVELSRALSIKSHTIDAEIAKSGATPNNHYGGKQSNGSNGNGMHRSNKNKKLGPNKNTAFVVSTQQVQHKGGQYSGPPKGKGQGNQQGHKAEAFYTDNPPNNRNGNNNGKGRGGNNRNPNNRGFSKGNGNSSNNVNGFNPNNGNKRGNNRYNGNKQGYKPRDYCSLCGSKNHLATDGCPNIQDDMGKIIPVLPCQNTCPDCPSTVHPRLNHSAAYCPFRISGPLHGTK